jgi:peptidoglycan/LPS O-acetylase OafA/YrhL
MSREDLKPLTALRFFAALLVFAFHLPQTMVVAYAFTLGYAGVGFFFLLSGFILTYSYQRVFDGIPNSAAIVAFYVSRIARIYPLLVASTLIMLAVLTSVGGILWDGQPAGVRATALAFQLTLLQSWVPAPEIHFGINGPAWTLSVEAFFYALFPFIAVAMFRIFRDASTSRVLIVATLLWVALVAVIAPIPARLDEWSLYVFPPTRLIEFVLGMMLGIAFLRGGASARWPLRPLSVEILALAGAALSITVSPLLPLSLRFSAWLVPAWCAVIFVFACRRGTISRALAHPAMVRLGEISYAFYLCHLAVISLLRHTIGDRHPLLVPIAFGATMALSFALHHAIEQPLRTRIRARFAERTQRVAIVGVARSADVP